MYVDHFTVENGRLNAYYKDGDKMAKVDLGNVVGPPGAKGDTGPQGIQGEPGPQGDPGEGLSDNAKALLLSLLADTALDRDAALAALRVEWGFAEPDDTTPEAADAAEPEA